MKFWLNILTILILISRLVADKPTIERRIYYTSFTNPHSPQIDGHLDDPAWQQNEWGKDFIQVEPEEGAQPSQKTAFKILYDNKNLYVAIRVYDTEPQHITRRVTRRDDIDDSDFVGVMIDSYFDHRSAFEFSINAAGVKRDAFWSEGGDNSDDGWDPVWFASVSTDDQGWIAEMRIPFSQLRFGKQDEYVWGLQVFRYLYRQQEWSYWQFIPQDASEMIHLFGELQGIKNIHTPRRIELLPYSLSKMNAFRKEVGNPFAPGRITDFNGGLDGKIGLTSDLTLDFTVNPDFGQVEADPSVVNLTAFETFFEEKRPFFIEGKNILDFPLAFGDSDFSRESLFYSRRIGRSPQYWPDLEDEEHLKMPENTSIVSALKLSGKTRTGISIGVLNAVTAAEKAEIDFNGKRRRVTVEPLTNYFVSRLQKDFDQGNTIIGGMFTATHRNITESHLNFLNRAAYSGGLDFSRQWKNKTYSLNFKFAFSHVWGHQDAMVRLQRSSARYFQRPDANYLTLDSNRTSLSGHGGLINFGKFGGGHWRFAVGGVWRSPGLELNDVGFLLRADRVMQYVWIQYREWNPTGIFRHFSININQWNGWNFGGEKIFTGGNINGGGQFRNYWGFWTGINREMPQLSLNELRGGPALRIPGGWSNWFNIYSDERKAFQFRLGGFNWWQDASGSRVHNLFTYLSWRPTDALSFSLSPFYRIRLDDLQYITTIERDQGDRYIFGRINQKTMGIVLRLNFSLTPDISLQYYGQPFISVGKYSKFKRITRTRAEQYEDRFHTFRQTEIHYLPEDEVYEIDEDRDGSVDYSVNNPDFNFRQFRSNLVIRWEYKPGSTIFLVWAQERTGAESTGDFAFWKDFNSLFEVYPNNIFLIKINHWFSL